MQSMFNDIILFALYYSDKKFMYNIRIKQYMPRLSFLKTFVLCI